MKGGPILQQYKLEEVEELRRVCNCNCSDAQRHRLKPICTAVLCLLLWLAYLHMNPIPSIGTQLRMESLFPLMRIRPISRWY